MAYSHSSRAEKGTVLTLRCYFLPFLFSHSFHWNYQSGIQIKIFIRGTREIHSRAAKFMKFLMNSWERDLPESLALVQGASSRQKTGRTIAVSLALPYPLSSWCLGGPQRPQAMDWGLRLPALPFPFFSLLSPPRCQWGQALAQSNHEQRERQEPARGVVPWPFVWRWWRCLSLPEIPLCWHRWETLKTMIIYRS